MKYLFVFCVCVIMFFQSSCITFTKKQIKTSGKKVNNNNEQELISVSSLLLRVPEKTVLQMGLLGSAIGELSPSEANKLLGSLKQQAGVELVSLNSCAFVSGGSGVCRDVTEYNSPAGETDTKTTTIKKTDLKAATIKKTDAKTTDVGGRFTVQGSYNSNQDTINLKLNEEYVIIPGKHIKKSSSIVERMDLTTSLIVKDGHTLLIGKLFFPYNSMAQSGHKEHLLFFVTAKRLGVHKKLKKFTSAQDKMVNINALILKVPRSFAAKWGLDGTPPLNPEMLPLRKAIPEYMSSKEKEILLSALLKQPEVQIIREQAILIKNGTEGSLRYVCEAEDKPELGVITRISPKINDKNDHISFNFSPTSQLSFSASSISATTIDIAVCLKNGYTLLLKKTLSNEDKDISLLFLTAKIIGDNDK